MGLSQNARVRGGGTRRHRATPRRLAEEVRAERGLGRGCAIESDASPPPGPAFFVVPSPESNVDRTTLPRGKSDGEQETSERREVGAG